MFVVILTVSTKSFERRSGKEPPIVLQDGVGVNGITLCFCLKG